MDVKTYFPVGKEVYLAELFPDLDVPLGYQRKYFRCKLLSLRVGKPICVELLSSDYPSPPGMVVDRVEKTPQGIILKCTFRDLEAMRKYIFLMDYVKHLEPLSYRLGALVFDIIWTNQIVQFKTCPQGSKCDNEELDHLSRYKHD